MIDNVNDNDNSVDNNRWSQTTISAMFVQSDRNAQPWELRVELDTDVANSYVC